MKYDSTTNEYIYTRVNGTEYRIKDPFPAITSTYWGQNEPWNLEHKITWDEIAPSLQELIIYHISLVEWENLGPVLQARILADEETIKQNKESIKDEITDRIAADSDLQDQITTLSVTLTNTANALSARVTACENDCLNIWTEINNVLKPDLLSLHTITDDLYQKINQIWGSSIYQADYSTYDIYHLWQELFSLKERVNQLEQGTGNLEDRVAALENEVNKIKLTLISMQDEIDNLDARVAILESEINKLKLAVANLQDEINQLKLRLTNSQEGSDDLEARITALEIAVNSINQKLTNLQNEIDEIKPKVTFYIDEFTVNPNIIDGAAIIYIHFSNKFCIQLIHANVDRNDAYYQNTGSRTSDPSTYHGWVKDPDGIPVPGTVTQLARPFSSSVKFGGVMCFFCIPVSDEWDNTSWLDSTMQRVGCDQTTIMHARPYGSDKILLSSLTNRDTETWPNGTVGPARVPNSNFVLCMGFTD